MTNATTIDSRMRDVPPGASSQAVAGLVAQVLGGEREAFGPLVQRYYPSVLRLCRRLVGGAYEAEDIAQEAALRAFLELRHLQDPGSFGAWFHAIAANCARMALRRRQTLSLDALSTGVLSGGSVLTPAWTPRIPTPEDAHGVREIHDTILAAINDLSSVNREVVIGFYLDGYSYAEMAQLLDVPVSAVRGRLFHGRRQLRRALQPLAADVLSPDRRPRKERPMAHDTLELVDELIEVTIDSGSLDWLTQHQIAVLREPGGDRFLPLWIGPFEANAIALAIQGVRSLRPLTHDLTLRILEQMDGQVQRVVIHSIVDKAYIAEIVIAQGEQVHRIESRPSDAIALALRIDAPIFVTRELFQRYGLTPSGMRPAPRKLQVVLISENPKHLGMCTCVLFFEPNLELAAKATSFEQGLALVAERQPDLVVLDLPLNSIAERAAVEELLRLAPRAQIIPFVEQDARPALPMSAQVRPALAKPVSNEAIVTAIRQATGL